MSSSGPSGPTGSSSKNVKLIAGQAGVPGSLNGTGGGATFYYPAGVAMVGTMLYVADSNNSIIRQVDPATGAVTTLAGAGYSGWANGIGTAAVFDFPEGITTDGTSLYVADSGSNVIRKITVPGAVVTTIAGTPGAVGSQDSAGATPSNPVAFNNPLGITSPEGTSTSPTPATPRSGRLPWPAW